MTCLPDRQVCVINLMLHDCFLFTNQGNHINHKNHS